ncbi:MAG: response regulator [Candidatus Riflebacteria bacterium]|nr:response regulator [Candidatus Riflebacteria bacterium]
MIQRVLDAMPVSKMDDKMVRPSSDLFESAPIGIFHSTIEGRFLRVNPCLANLLGYDSPEQMISNASVPAILVDVSPERRKRFIERILASTGFIRYENDYRRQDGSVICLLLMCRAVHNPTGETTYLEGFLQDLSEQRKLEKEVRRIRDVAEKAVHARSAFLSNMSHEIRAPLYGVHGLTELLLETSLTPDQHELLSTLRSSADLLLNTVNEILDFSKIEAGKMSLEILEFSPKHIIEEIIRLLRAKANEKDLTVSFEIEPAVPKILRGDPLRIRQILLNLVGNALKFTQEGFVRISVTEECRDETFSRVRFAIIDTGMGIPPQSLVRLFEPFVQSDPSKEIRQSDCTGLGLVIAKRLIELMGGQIGVTSRVGKGSTFWFTVSFALVKTVSESSNDASKIAESQQSSTTTSAETDLAEAATPDATSSESEIARTKQVRNVPANPILVVEDDPIHQRVIELLLRRQQLPHLIVANGRSAIEAYEREPFSMILMDIRIPAMNGYEVTRLIRKLEKQSETRRRIPIIAITSDASNEDRNRCFEAGMDGHIAKPIGIDVLYQTIDRWLERTNSDHEKPEAPVEGDDINAVPELSGNGLNARILEQVRGLQLNGDPDFMEHLIHIFLRDMPGRLDLLIDALKNERNQSIRIAASSMKLSCLSIGATELAELLQEIETHALQGECRPADIIIPRIRKEYSRARSALTAILDHRIRV